MHTSTVRKLRKRLAKATFLKDGDDFERQFGRLVTVRFPRLESFWQQCIVPLSTRIDQKPGIPAKIRKDVDEDVRLMSYAHYTTFLHLLYARFRYNELVACLGSRVSPFGAFYSVYAHLGSACDLAEEFLFHVRVVTVECLGNPADANRLRTDWEKRKYRKGWRHGKIDQYFAHSLQSRFWDEYKKFTNELRKYCNAVVHHVAMGAHVDLADWTHRVPKKEKISNYTGLTPVLEATPQVLQKDFISMEPQAASDLDALERRLHRLWKRPYDELTRMLYRNRNRDLLAKYRLALT